MRAAGIYSGSFSLQGMRGAILRAVDVLPAAGEIGPRTRAGGPGAGEEKSTGNLFCTGR